MSAEYTAAPLDPRDVDPIFPLAHALDRTLDLVQWRAFAAAMAAAGEREPVGAAGITAIRSARGYFVGLFGHDVVPIPGRGPVLRVEPLLLVDRLLHADAAPALAASLRGLARRYACRVVQVTRPESGGRAAATATALAQVLGPVSRVERPVRFWWRLDTGGGGPGAASDPGTVGGG